MPELDRRALLAGTGAATTLAALPQATVASDASLGQATGGPWSVPGGLPGLGDILP